MRLSLVRPTADIKEAVLDYKNEHFLYGEYEISGGERLDCMDSYEKWLQYVTDNASAETVSPEWVVSDLFLALDEKTYEQYKKMTFRYLEKRFT